MPKAAKITGTSPRERIVETAAKLFYAEGIRAVGIDTIINRAGVAKASFYKYFPSKDDLVLEFLRRRDTFLRDWLEQAVARLSPDPAGRPLAVFDALAQRFAAKEFRGCAFINAMVEMADRAHAAHLAADGHKREMTVYLRNVLAMAKVPQSDTLAPELMMLIDGAIVTAVREGSPRAAESAKRIAAVLLQQAGAPTS